MSYKRGTYDKHKLKYELKVFNDLEENKEIIDEKQFHSIPDVCKYLNENYNPSHNLTYNQISKIIQKNYIFNEKSRSPDTKLFRRLEINQL